jgi:hypothetical protein
MLLRCLRSIFFNAWDTATKPNVAVTIVTAPSPLAQSMRPDVGVVQALSFFLWIN